MMPLKKGGGGGVHQVMALALGFRTELNVCGNGPGE